MGDRWFAPSSGSSHTFSPVATRRMTTHSLMRLPRSSEASSCPSGERVRTPAHLSVLHVAIDLPDRRSIVSFPPVRPAETPSNSPFFGKPISVGTPYSTHLISSVRFPVSASHKYTLSP